ncbi:hypothetical protein ABLE93_06045 [Xanthobacter sp. KR7-65]|uniref:hypothetical protein n=1 Tax=Xanthobacter sp. KR7-65 TaxID=3156612 RepID=UPI0032B62523
MTDPSSEQALDAAATAAYVAAITAELSRLARGHGFVTLAYILEMARQEAKSLTDVRDRRETNGSRPPGRSPQR